MFPTTGQLQKVCVCLTTVCLGLALGSTYHWPLVGDATLMHYVVFLTRHGMKPYADIIEINLPGSYFFETLGMRCFGGGSVGWRLYDTSLMILLVVACCKFAARSNNRLAGFFAAALFWLVHLQDGIFQEGQRDLLMAALLVWSYVVLGKPLAGNKQRNRPFFFGVLMGTLVTIKPVLLPLQLALLFHYAGRRRSSYAAILLMACLGFALPMLLVLLWLRSEHAILPFWHILTQLLPLHSSLGNQRLPFLLVRALAPFAVLLLPWIALRVSAWSKWTFYDQQLLIGIGGALAAYVTQGKGYPYHRYPLLILFLVAVCIELFRNLSGKFVFTRVVAVTTCLVLCVIVAPQLAYRTYTFSNAAPFQTSLESSLTSIDSPQKLSGNVQCLDTFGGCIGSLYDLKVVQATGYLYDCYLFSPPSNERATYRAGFIKAFQEKQPKIVVLTNQFCFGNTREGFDKNQQVAGICLCACARLRTA